MEQMVRTGEIEHSAASQCKKSVPGVGIRKNLLQGCENELYSSG